MVPDSTNVPSPVDRTSDSKIATPSPVGSTVAWTSPARSSVRSTWLVADVLARRLPSTPGTGPALPLNSRAKTSSLMPPSGPLILGHAHPAVVAAVRDALEHGTTYFLVNEPIVRLADELCRAVPCAEQVRFTSTGTEATFFALRAARAFRGRDKVMKFEGGYHGGHDYALMSAAPRSAGNGRSCAPSTRAWKAPRISSRRSAR